MEETLDLKRRHNFRRGLYEVEVVICECSAVYILLYDDICCAGVSIVDGFAYAAVSLLLDLSSFYLVS